MMIALWMVLRILFLGTAIFLLVYLIINSKNKDALHVLARGIQEGLRRCGLIIAEKDQYTVELYKWVALDDGEACEDCLQRASWPAMDIADWMKKGLPKTLEAHTQCGEHCRCQLVFYKSKKSEKQYHNS